MAPALAIVAAIGSDITRGAILADTGPDGRHGSRECMLALVEAFGARVAEAGTARPSRSQRRRQATCRRDCRNISSRLSSSCGSRTSSGFHDEINARVTVDTPIGEPHFYPAFTTLKDSSELSVRGSTLALRPRPGAWRRGSPTATLRITVSDLPPAVVTQVGRARRPARAGRSPARRRSGRRRDRSRCRCTPDAQG